MDCDAKKKTMLKDLDGSFLGSVGAVIPQSEFEWDGDDRRGLGDYRIPKVALTHPNGSRIPVEQIAPNKGNLDKQRESQKKNVAGEMCRKKTGMLLYLAPPLFGKLHCSFSSSFPQVSKFLILEIRQISKSLCFAPFVLRCHQEKLYIHEQLAVLQVFRA